MCMCVALTVRHAMRMGHFVIYDGHRSKIFFHIIS